MWFCVKCWKIVEEHIIIDLKQNKSECLKMTLCKTENEFNDRQCYERNCTHCGVHHINLHFQQLIEKRGEQSVKCKRWETIKVIKKKKIKAKETKLTVFFKFKSLKFKRQWSDSSQSQKLDITNY